MKKYNWAKYNRGDEIIEITVKDPSGAKEESISFNKLDKKNVARALKYLEEKWGLDTSFYRKVSIEPGITETDESFFEQ